jgi:hypothetical protein
MAFLRTRVLLAAGFVATTFGMSTAQAGPITVDWDVVPHDDREIHFDDSPRYQCDGDRYAERLCQSLWQGGLELGATMFSFYDDKWFDGYGVTDAPVGRIQPVCKAGLRPCFNLFTPIVFRIEGDSNLGPAPNLFLASSSGGYLEFPSVNGVTTINFSGPLWENLAWMDFGFFTPAACQSDDPPDGCDGQTEKALIPQDLTFQPVPDVPEPAAVALLGAGVLSMIARRRRSSRPIRTRPTVSASPA